MSDSDAPAAPDLRADLARTAQTTDVVERTLEVVALIEAVAAPLGIHPVVVGGMAVYFWVESEAFLTYDIDVVMEVPAELDAKLAELGFVRAPDGRHWELPGTEVFFEAPSANLDPDVVVAEVELPSGRRLKASTRASNHRVGTILKAMRDLADDLAAGRGPPESDELHDIANAALKAEYSRGKP
jgi:hypothetical protein